MVWAKLDVVLPFDEDVQKMAEAISQNLADGIIDEDEATERMTALLEAVDAKAQVIEKGQLSLF